jgi:hypothetical protein
MAGPLRGFDAIHFGRRALIPARASTGVDLTVDLFGEQTVQVLTAAAWATIALLVGVVFVRLAGARAARAMMPVRVNQPMATHQVVVEATGNRARSIERLGSCLPTRAPPSPFHRPRPSQSGDSPG